jgi:hypothetical protein
MKYKEEHGTQNTEPAVDLEPLTIVGQADSHAVSRSILGELESREGCPSCSSMQDGSMGCRQAGVVYARRAAQQQPLSWVFYQVL